MSARLKTIHRRRGCVQLGEVWGEIGRELAREGVELTSTDEEALATVERASGERTRGVAILQRELLHAERNQNFVDENNTYLHVSAAFLTVSDLACFLSAKV